MYYARIEVRPLVRRIALDAQQLGDKAAQPAGKDGTAHTGTGTKNCSGLVSTLSSSVLIERDAKGAASRDGDHRRAHRRHSRRDRCDCHHSRRDCHHSRRRNRYAAPVDEPRRQ